MACSDYYQSKLALEWRQWLTERLTAEYFYDRTFYQVQVTRLGACLHGWWGLPQQCASCALLNQARPAAAMSTQRTLA